MEVRTAEVDRKIYRSTVFVRFSTVNRTTVLK